MIGTKPLDIEQVVIQQKMFLLHENKLVLIQAKVLGYCI